MICVDWMGYRKTSRFRNTGPLFGVLLQPHECVEKSRLAYVRPPHQGQFGEACVRGRDLPFSSGIKTNRHDVSVLGSRDMANKTAEGGGVECRKLPYGQTPRYGRYTQTRSTGETHRCLQNKHAR